MVYYKKGLKMNRCKKCKYRNSPVCEPCTDGNLWVKDNTFTLIISAMLFGSGIGGVLMGVYFHFNPL